MLFTSLPPPPPSFSHDTINTIQSLYETSADSELYFDQSQKRKDTNYSSSRVVETSSDDTKLNSDLLNKYHAVEEKLVPSSGKTSTFSSYKSVYYLDDTYKSACSLDVEKGDSVTSMSSNSISSNIRNLNSKQPLNEKEESLTVKEYLESLRKQNGHVEDVGIQNHPQYQELLKENVRLKTKMSLLESQSIKFDSENQLQQREMASFKKIQEYMGFQLQVFEKHMKTHAMTSWNNDCCLWIHPFASTLFSVQSPTIVDVLDSIQNLILHFQVQFDSISENRPNLHKNLQSHQKHLSKQNLEQHGLAKFKSCSSSLTSSNSSLAASYVEKNVEPICTSCLRLTNSLESQTQSLSKLLIEMKNNKEKLSAMLHRLEFIMEQKDTKLIISSTSIPNAPYSMLDKFEEAFYNFNQKSDEKLRKLEEEVASLTNAKKELEAEVKHKFQDYQGNLYSLENELQATKNEVVEFKANYENQREISKKLKEKETCLKNLVHQIEKHTVEEIMKHKSTKELCEQLKCRIKSLKEIQEHCETDLASAKEDSKKLNFKLQRQSGYLQQLRNQKLLSKGEEASTKESFEECIQTLEETRTKLSNEKRLRLRLEAKIQGFQSRIELLQKLLDEKEEILPKETPESKRGIKKPKPELLYNHYQLNQYKLAISDYIQWLYSLNLKDKQDKEYDKKSSSSTSKVYKSLINRLSNTFLSIPYDELVSELEKARQKNPCQTLTSIFSTPKNLRKGLFQFLKDCTTEVLQTQNTAKQSMSLADE